MLPFNQLSKLERTRRLRRVALAALQHYPLNVETVRCVSLRFSTIFRVTTTNGEQYALRIDPPNLRTARMTFSEMYWVEALAHDTDLCVAAPLRTITDELLVTIEAPDLPEARQVVITQWLDGQLMTHYPDKHALCLLGDAMARLQQHASDFCPPLGFTQQQLDNPWQWGQPYYLHPHSHLLTPEQKAVFNAAWAACQTWLADLYTQPDQIRFLHADLHLKNVVLHQDKLQIFDFGDSIWGHPLQDLAVPLHWIATQLNDNATLKTALLESYSHRIGLRYSANQLHAAVLFRALQAANFMIHYRLDKYPSAINDATQFLRAWMR